MTTPDDEAACLAREAQLADLGELAGPLTHEFNNFLNNLALHLEIMKQTAAAGTMPDAERLRRQVTQTAGLIGRFQRYRRSGAAAESKVDLGRALREAADIVTQTPPEQGGVPLTVRTGSTNETRQPGVVTLSVLAAEGLPPVRGNSADLRRLC